MPGKGGTPFNEPSPLLPRDGASLRDDKPLVDLGANKYNKNVSDTPKVCPFFSSIQQQEAHENFEQYTSKEPHSTHTSGSLVHQPK